MAKNESETRLQEEEGRRVDHKKLFWCCRPFANAKQYFEAVQPLENWFSLSFGAAKKKTDLHPFKKCGVTLVCQPFFEHRTIRNAGLVSFPFFLPSLAEDSFQFLLEYSIRKERKGKRFGERSAGGITTYSLYIFSIFICLEIFDPGSSHDIRRGNRRRRSVFLVSSSGSSGGLVDRCRAAIAGTVLAAPSKSVCRVGSRSVLQRHTVPDLDTGRAVLLMPSQLVWPELQHQLSLHSRGM